MVKLPYMESLVGWSNSLTGVFYRIWRINWIAEFLLWSCKFVLYLLLVSLKFVNHRVFKTAKIRCSIDFLKVEIILLSTNSLQAPQCQKILAGAQNQKLIIYYRRFSIYQIVWLLTTELLEVKTYSDFNYWSLVVKNSIVFHLLFDEI